MLKKIKINIKKFIKKQFITRLEKNENKKIIKKDFFI